MKPANSSNTKRVCTSGDIPQLPMDPCDITSSEHGVQLGAHVSAAVLLPGALPDDTAEFARADPPEALLLSRLPTNKAASISTSDPEPRLAHTLGAFAFTLPPTNNLESDADSAAECGRECTSVCVPLPFVPPANDADSTGELWCHHETDAASPPHLSANNAASDTNATPGASIAILKRLPANAAANDAGLTPPQEQSTTPAAFMFGGSTSSTLSMLHRENSELRKKNADLSRRCKNLLKLHEQTKSKVRSLNNKLRLVQQELGALRSSTFLAADQTKALTTKGRVRKWSVQTVRVALQIKHACGTTGYELLRSLSYPLPSNRTLIRRMQNIRFLPGVLTEVLDVLKRKAETMEDIEKDCVLFMDEMEISQGFEHDRSLDCLFGGTTLPESTENVANHALVFMIGGLNTRWKQVIAYHFTGRSTDGSLLKELIFHLIALCFEVSLRVLVVTSDMGNANRKVWQLLEFSSHRHSETVCSIPHPHLDGRELYFMADPAHVLKNIRGQLLRSGSFTLGKETTEEHCIPGKTVSLEHVEAVLKYDRKNDLKIANKLSDIHVSDGHFAKMKVNIAVQLFREAPPAIRYLIKLKILDPEAEATAWFFDLVTKWYTLMSSRHPIVALSHFDRAKHQEAVGTLQLACATFTRMNMGATAHWKPSQAGLLVSTTVVLRLSEELLVRRGYLYLLTARLIQDCLENIFSVVRLKKPVPSAYDVKCALKAICVSQFVHTPKTSSYNIDDSSYLADLLDPSLKKLEEDPIQQAEELENLFVIGLTEAECDIVAYIGGFLLRSILKSIDNCKSCRAALTDSASGKYSSLIQLKEYVKNAGNLIQPSTSVMTVLMDCEENFKTFAEMDEVMKLKKPFSSILSALQKSVKMHLGCCSLHKPAVEKLLLEKYVRTRLKIYLRQQHAHRVNGAASKTCAAANLE